MLRTTHGPLDESMLERTLGFEERPKEYVVWVEWRLPAHDGVDCPTCADPQMPRPVDGKVLVRRDAWVNLKEPMVTAEGIAASL